jgi:hypothetical protein
MNTVNEENVFSALSMFPKIGSNKITFNK